ncbi:Rhodanese- sulfurtransferase [Malassezia yamatoensis]|uniref:Ribosome biogenesis regulatory protein n=1 Tax=Malassezia yamatoensis TaxID=253288 RepID=A0AAJ6CHA5_9BASI|nr:Rhodanese- sulfurtransferase [Malassezia yamatoensis]
MVEVSTKVEQGDVPLELDIGLLASFDYNPLDSKKYKKDREELLRERTRNATQFLVNAIFQQPISRSASYGPLASLPPFTSLVPREKPLPKSKPLTKWEKFARKKGISKKRKDRMVYDEERKEWVPRWGYQGANKSLENQWLVEVPTGADDDFRPDKEAAKNRKELRKKNEVQHQRNLAHAGTANATAPVTSAPKPGALGSGVASRSARKAELEAGILRAKGSTASMGRFDKTLQGESKPRGVKRSFRPNEVDASSERAANLALLSKIDKGGANLNMRKAIKHASDAQGSKSMVQRTETKRGPKRRK